MVPGVAGDRHALPVEILHITLRHPPLAAERDGHHEQRRFQVALQELREAVRDLTALTVVEPEYDRHVGQLRARREVLEVIVWVD